MKKTLVSIACTLALALAASAQTPTFAELPTVTAPTVLPNRFANLDWSGFYYVDPSWAGAGVGFRQGPAALNVGFMGGASCEVAEISCSASISSASSGASSAEGFRVQSAIVAAGNHSETIKVSAYSHGHFVGSEVYNLTTSLQTMNFPPGWGMVTQLVVDATRGTVVFYALSMESSSAITGEDLTGSAASQQKAGPTAPVGILDPPPPVGLPAIVQPPVIVLGPAAHNAAGSSSADGQAQSDDMIQNQGPNAVRTAQPQDMIQQQGPNAVRTAQPQDMIQQQGPNAVRTAQPEDMIYPGSNAVRGAQPVDPNATRKAEPE